MQKRKRKRQEIIMLIDKPVIMGLMLKMWMKLDNYNMLSNLKNKNEDKVKIINIICDIGEREMLMGFLMNNMH